MIKFHQIPTIENKPISHEKTYLFSNYEKVFNFLKFNYNIYQCNILSKPVQTSNNIDWYSNYSDLKYIEDLTLSQKKKILEKYWTFMDLISIEIDNLKSSKEEDKLNWANILDKIFNYQNNLIFSNGDDFSIIWGWEFYNNNNYKPNFNNIQIDVDDRYTSIHTELIDEEKLSVNNIDNDLFEEAESLSDLQEIESVDTVSDIKNESSFLKFLKWFAANFWWLLFLLLIICILMLLFTNCEHQENYNRLNNDIENIEGQLINICN